MPITLAAVSVNPPVPQLAGQLLLHGTNHIGGCSEEVFADPVMNDCVRACLLDPSSRNTLARENKQYTETKTIIDCAMCNRDCIYKLVVLDQRCDDWFGNIEQTSVRWFFA